MPWLVLAVLASAVVLVLAANLFEVRARTPWGHADPVVQVPSWIALASLTAWLWLMVLFDAALSPLAVAVYRACARWALPC